jgi:hypothetical protein
MNILERLLKIHHAKDGWTKVREPEIEHLNSRVYFEYKGRSDLYEHASYENFKPELNEASHALSTVIMYRNMYQLDLNERGEEDVVLIAKNVSCVSLRELNLRLPKARMHGNDFG